MDFLEIRRKAKERAAAHEAEPSSAEPLDLSADPPPTGAHLADRSAPAADAAASEPEELEDFQEAPAPPGAADARFTTWRPGSGTRPFIPAPEPGPEPQPELSDFAVFDPSRAAPRPEDPALSSPPPAPAVLLPVPLLQDPPPAAATAVRPQAPGARRAPAPDPLEEFFYRIDEQVDALSALPAEPEASPVSGPEDGGVEEYLTFRLGTEEYAVPIARVREVLKATPVTEVPRAPTGILGVVTVRGEVVPVFDPRRRLGLPGPLPAPGTGRIVIVDDGEGPSGLLVDGVASVVRLARGSIEPCPQGIGGSSAECLAGIGRERARLFTVLDLEALLRRAPAAGRGGGRAHDGA